MQSIPEQVAYIASVMFNRNLTDISGGNASAREGSTIYCTPRYAGSRKHWRLEASDIVSGPFDSDELLENPRFSREGISHLLIYRAFPEAQAVIHAHPPHVQVFCSLERPIEPVLSGTRKYGVIDLAPHTPAYSREQGESIVAYFQERRGLIQSAAAAVLLPQHGIFLASASLWAAIDALERINNNAWCLIARKILLQ
jgi:L-fuculose-phosphate aldolase